MSIETPFARSTATILPQWIDHNGHMNVGYYHVVFDIAADPFFEFLGLVPDIRKTYHSSTFALESHLHFHREVKVGEKVRFEARLLDADRKRIHYYQEMFHADEGHLVAAYESLSMHVDMRVRKTSPMPDPLYDRLQQVLAAHRALPRPWQVGHVIGQKPPR